MFLLLTLNIAQHEPLNLPFLFIILKSYVPDGHSYNNSNCFTPSPITKHLDLKQFLACYRGLAFSAIWRITWKDWWKDTWKNWSLNPLAWEDVESLGIHDIISGSINPFNYFQLNVAFYVQTSHLICTANQMTGFYMECNTGLKWVAAS